MLLPVSSSFKSRSRGVGLVEDYRRLSLRPRLLVGTKLIGYLSSDVIPTARGLTPIYLGMVRWQFEDHRIVLMPDGARRERKLHITFSSSGTQETRRQCVINFVRFVDAYGVKAQWEADGTNRIHQRFWLAAEHAWGLPRWTEHL